MRTNPPLELIQALRNYFYRFPEKGNTRVMSKCNTNLQMKDIPDEILKGTEIGIDYEKAMYKMAFEDLIDGRKQL